MTRQQQKLFNAACGDLAAHLHWHGTALSKNGWRHLLSGLVLGQRVVPSWDYADGRQVGLVLLGGSSRKLTNEEANEAITMAYFVGDYPEDQGIKSSPVPWCDVVRLERGIFTDGEPADTSQ